MRSPHPPPPASSNPMLKKHKKTSSDNTSPMEKNFRLVGLSVPGGLLITLRGHLEMIQDWVRLVSTAPLKLLSSDWPFESKCLQGGGVGGLKPSWPPDWPSRNCDSVVPQWYPPARGGVALAVARRPPPKRGVTPFAAQGMVLPPHPRPRALFPSASPSTTSRNFPTGGRHASPSLLWNVLRAALSPVST